MPASLIAVTKVGSLARPHCVPGMLMISPSIIYWKLSLQQSIYYHKNWMFNPLTLQAAHYSNPVHPDFQNLLKSSSFSSTQLGYQEHIKLATGMMYLEEIKIYCKIDIWKEKMAFKFYSDICILPHARYYWINLEISAKQSPCCEARHASPA